MPQRLIAGFQSKVDLITEHVRDRNVLHLGAVGETNENTEVRVQRADDSTHALITRLAKRCVGVDHDAPSVTLLRERGIFDNILLGDVTQLTRSDIDLPGVDVIVAGDTVEHLGHPQALFDVAAALADSHTQLIVTTPNSLGLGIALGNLRGRVLEGDDHVCSFNAFTLGNLIERGGWRLDELWSCYQPKARELNPYAFRVGRALLARIPRLGGTLYAVCSQA